MAIFPPLCCPSPAQSFLFVISHLSLHTLQPCRRRISGNRGGGSSHPPKKTKTSAVQLAPFAAADAAEGVVVVVAAAAACTAAEPPQAESTSVQPPAAASTAPAPAAALLESTTDNAPPADADATAAAAATPRSPSSSSLDVTTSADALGPSDGGLSHALAAAADNYCARGATDAAHVIYFLYTASTEKERKTEFYTQPDDEPPDEPSPNCAGTASSSEEDHVSAIVGTPSFGADHQAVSAKVTNVSPLSSVSFH